jgi:hypothetical protein
MVSFMCKSVVTFNCKSRELSNGNLNFINVSSQFYNKEIAEFDFVVSWILQEGVNQKGRFFLILILSIINLRI